MVENKREGSVPDPIYIIDVDFVQEISKRTLDRTLTEKELEACEKTIVDAMADHIADCIQATIDYEMWMEEKFGS